MLLFLFPYHYQLVISHHQASLYWFSGAGCLIEKVIVKCKDPTIESDDKDKNEDNKKDEEEKMDTDEDKTDKKDDVEETVWIFPSNQWLDKGEGDKKIERTLYPEKEKEEEEQTDAVAAKDEEEPPKEQKYKLWIDTSDDSKEAEDMQAVLVLYGERDKSKELVLTKDGAFNFVASNYQR